MKKLKNDSKENIDVSWENNFDFIDNEKNNFIHYTIAYDRQDLLDKIISQKSKEDIASLIHSKNSLGDTPVHLAVWADDQVSLNKLAFTVPHFDLYDMKGRNPLMIGIKLFKEKLINICLEKTQIINHQDQHGKTILHYCQIIENVDLFTKFQKQGADITIKNNLGQIAELNINKEEVSLDEVQTVISKVKIK